MLLVDTRVLIWLTGDCDRLSAPARRALESPSEALHVCAISALEVGLAYKKKRVVLPAPPEVWFGQVTAALALNVLLVSWEIAAGSAALPDVHADPFDRIIVATALAHGSTIVTPDTEIARYPGVSVVW